MKTSSTSVAIIVSCFNRWPHVCEAIDSVLQQTWSNTECVVVDDASTDDTADKIEEAYGDNPRVTLLRLSQNQGQSAARNAGARAAQAQYIGFLDSDDLLVDTSIESRMQVALAHPDFPGLIFGDKVDEKTLQSLLPSKTLENGKLTLNMYIADFSWLHTNSFLMLRSAFQKLTGFNETLRKKEDIEFFIRALQQAPARYAPGACCMVREMDMQRARHDHTRIVEQGERFIQAIEENAGITSRLSTQEFQTLIEGNAKSVLNSLYRLKKGRLYRKRLRQAIKQNQVKLSIKLAKRFALSFFHG